MPRCPADLLRLSPRILVFFSICLLWCPECLDTHSFLCRFLQDFSCARIVSTNSALPGKSRLFPLRLYCVINFFFGVHFCAFLHFSSRTCSCKETLFCSNFLELSSCALSCCKTLFYSTFRNIQRIKLFFVRTFAHFIYFPLCRLLSEKVGKNCCHVPIYSRVT